MEAEELVFDGRCKGEAVEEVVELAEDAAEVIDVLAQTDGALFAEAADTVDGRIFVPPP